MLSTASNHARAALNGQLTDLLVRIARLLARGAPDIVRVEVSASATAVVVKARTATRECAYSCSRLERFMRRLLVRKRLTSS
jgi:hypothetical protein